MSMIDPTSIEKALETLKRAKQQAIVFKFINNTSPPTRILRWPDVAKRIPFSKSYAYALQAKGLFPKPIKLIKGGRAAGYLESEINDWVNARIAEARGDNL